MKVKEGQIWEFTNDNVKLAKKSHWEIIEIVGKGARPDTFSVRIKCIWSESGAHINEIHPSRFFPTPHDVLIQDAECPVVAQIKKEVRAHKRDIVLQKATASLEKYLQEDAT